MEGQRQKSGGSRRRRRRSKTENKPKAEPVLIVARRPDSPLLAKLSNRSIAASAQPKRTREDDAKADSARKTKKSDEKPRRTARIVHVQAETLDDNELQRLRLLERLADCEGRAAITRAADALLTGGFAIPEEQEAQLQLLEHVDEKRARAAIEVMARLLQNEAPIKRPILDRRLRRLEEEADELGTRECAAALRRSIRVA